MIQEALSNQQNQVSQLYMHTKIRNYSTVLDLEFSSSISKIKIVGPHFISFYVEETHTFYVIDTQQYVTIAKIALDIKPELDENYFIDSLAKYLILSFRDERNFKTQIIEIETNKTKNFENLKIIGIQEQSFFALGKGKLLYADYIQSSIFRIDFQGLILQILKPIVHQLCYYNCFNNIVIYQREINQIKILSQKGKFMIIHLNMRLIELKESSTHSRFLLLKKVGFTYCSFYLKIKQSLKLIRKNPCYSKNSYQVDMRQNLFICQRDLFLQQHDIKTKIVQQLKNESIYCSESQLKNLQGVIVHEKSISVIKP